MVNELEASLGGWDVPSDWRPGGRGFNPRRGRQHSFIEIDHEIFSTVVLSLLLIIPPTYEVCGIYSFRFSVRPFVRTYVRSLQGRSIRVKIYKTHILKTFWWISFIFGMMVDIGLKFLSDSSPPRGWPWGQGHGLRIFMKKSKFFVFKFI